MGRVVAIIGMGRSGTSLIAHCAMEAGLYLGTDLLPPAAENPDGFFEDPRIMAINDQVLYALGCSWNSIVWPGERELRDSRLDPLRSEAQDYIRSHFLGQASDFGFKDPRTARLLPFWQGVFHDLGVSERYLLCVRNPLSVARSLMARDNMPEAHALFLWASHTASALHYTFGRDLLTVDYDALMEDPIPTVQLIARWVTPPRQMPNSDAARIVEACLSPDLRHHRATRGDLQSLGSFGSLVTDLYDIALALCAGSYGAPQHSRVARILSHLRFMSRSFSAVPAHPS